jgi:predicted transcriptional regulator of viral defense system
MRELDRRLAAVAAGQHSIITIAQVLEAGGGPGDAARRVQSGRWERIAPGVYRIAGVPWTYPAQVFAATLAAGPGAVASHLCAARLHGLGFTKAGPELSIPRGRRHRPDGVRVHESTDLDRCAVDTIDAIPVTDVGRTLLDVGRYVRVPSLTKAVEEARRQELVTWNSLLHTLLAHARQGRHGVSRLREVLASGLQRDGITDTDSELVALTLLLERGFTPPPVLHHQVRAADGRLLAEIDLAFPGQLAAIEIDGTVHLRPEVKAKDEARDHMLRRMGWTIRRVWCEVPVLEPEQFVAIVRSLLDETRSVTPGA